MKQEQNLTGKIAIYNQISSYAKTCVIYSGAKQM